MNTVNTVQIIWNGCDDYAIAENCDEAEIPDFPIQLRDGTLKHRADFSGQLVVFGSDGVSFGFLAEEVPASEVQRDEDGGLILDGAYHVSNSGILLIAEGRFFREI